MQKFDPIGGTRPPYVPQPDPAQGEKKRLRRFANLFGAAGLVYFAVNLAGSFVFSFLLDLVYNITGTYLFGSSQNNYYVLNILVYLTSFLASFGTYALLLKMPLKAALPLRPVDGVNTLLSIPATFCFAVVGSMITSILASLISITGFEPVNPEMPIPQTVTGYLLYFFLLVILPPVIEEIAFRGVLMQSLRRYGDGFALLVSAIMFGLFHLNLIQGPYAFLLGLWMGNLVLRTGSLRITMVLHGCINLSAGILTIVMDGADEQTLMLINAIYIMFWLSVGAICLVTLLVRNRAAGLALHPARTWLSGGQKLGTYFGSPVILLLLAVIAFFMLQNFRRIGW